MGHSTAKKRRWTGARCVKDRYWYVRPVKGGPEIPIRAEFGTRDWEIAYHEARGGDAIVPRRLNRRVGSYAKITFGEAIERYRRSTVYANLAPATKERRERDFKAFLPQYADAPLTELTQARLMDLLAEMKAKKHIAHVMTMRMLYRYINGMAIAAGEPKLDDPTLQYPLPKPAESKGFRIWKPNHIEAFRNRWPLGSLQRMIFELAYETCQRGSDLRRMKWPDVVEVVGENGERYRAIHVLSQEKTKATVLVPISDELQEALDAWKAFCEERQSEIIANRTKWTREGSKMWQNNMRLSANADRRRESYADLILRSPDWLYGVNKQRFNRVMRDAIKAIGLPTYKAGDATYENFFSTHGLRKAGMSAIAEAGGNTLQIMAISGHTSQRNVDWYVKDREKQMAAVAAMQLRQARTAKLKAARAAETEADKAGKIVPLGRNKQRP